MTNFQIDVFAIKEVTLIKQEQPLCVKNKIHRVGFDNHDMKFKSTMRDWAIM